MLNDPTALSSIRSGNATSYKNGPNSLRDRFHPKVTMPMGVL